MATQTEINNCVMQAHANLEAVKSMVESDPALLTGDAEWVETPIQAATHMGRIDIVEYLLEQGVELNFFTAAMLGRTDVVSCMLEEKPELAMSNGVHNIPALFFPALHGHLEIAEMILERGANVNAGRGGNMPLHAAAMGGQVGMSQWLLDHGADPTGTNFDGKTPREVATATGHDAVAVLFPEEPASTP